MTDRAYIAEGAVLAEGVSVGPFSVVHEGASIGRGSVIGSGTVVHGGTVIGADCVVEDNVVLGKRPRLRPGSSAAAGDPLGGLEIGDGATVCCGAVLYAGAWVGERAIIGDQTQVRERSVVGARSVVGRGSCVDFAAVVGERALIQSGVYVTANSVVEDDVFLGPGVSTTNDNDMGRHPKGAPLQGVLFRRACRVGNGVILLPGIEVGEEAFVAAGSLVTRDVAPRDLVMGVPARVVRQVPDEALLERWR